MTSHQYAALRKALTQARENNMKCPICTKKMDTLSDGLFNCRACDQRWKRCLLESCRKWFSPNVSPPSRHKFCHDSCRTIYGMKLEKKRKIVRTKKAKRMCHRCKKYPVPKHLYWLCETCYRYGSEIVEHRIRI